MNPLVYHIVSGQAFFTGVALVILAAACSGRTGALARRVTGLSLVLGAIAISVSSAAIPYWYYAVAIVVTLLWTVSWKVKHWRMWSRYAMMIAWVGAAAFELPYHLKPTLDPAPSRKLTVVGDSVTAGMGGSDASERWPQLLAQEHSIDVQDISHMGETAASAWKRVQTNSITSPVVLLEIGGNDLLGSTSPAQFAIDLDRLLAEVTAPGRQIVMFELPLPPFYHEFGRIQRTLAREHQVSLIPKRVLLSVLAAEDATLDTIHLTQAGHERMAECVWGLVREAYE